MKTLYLPLLAAAVILGLPLAGQMAPITLHVDAGHASEHYLAVRMQLPVKPGPLTLYYPKWIPGQHRPDGPLAGLTGLRMSAGGASVPWRRDPVNGYAFHLVVPQGARALIVGFDYVEPALAPGQLTGGASATPKLVIINWNDVLLYPGGTPVPNLTYVPTLLLPASWNFGTALPGPQRSGATVRFAPVALNRLVDSPLIAGAYFRAVNITPPGEPIHHELDMVADQPQDLNLSPAIRQGLTNLVAQAGLLFGSRHYRDYHFLLTLSDYVPHFGVEHHESDDARLPARTLLGPRAALAVGGLLAHEYVHSWNGKFRRPAPMSVPYYQAPQQTSMLWAYEGITNFLGYELAARSGLWSKADYRRILAGVAAQMGPGRPGRQWRSLADTGSGLHADNGLPDWITWTRSAADFHLEGALLWWDAAMAIARQSHGTKSFDDFCRLFYGGPNLGPQLRPYTFAQLVAALNQVVPYDWADFLIQRVDRPTPQPPLAGMEASGWRLVFTSQPPGGPASQTAVA
ncbi:MAG: M61 family peptidase, partial [Terriglobales bacterium]